MLGSITKEIEHILLTQRNPIATATFTVIFYELVQPFFFHSIIEEFPYGILLL